MKNFLKKIYHSLLLNEEGQLSTSRLGFFIGLFYLALVIYQLHIEKLEFSEGAAQLIAIIIGALFAVRTLDRFSRYGFTGVTGGARIGSRKKKPVQKEEAFTEPEQEEKMNKEPEEPGTYDHNEMIGYFRLNEFRSKDTPVIPANVEQNLVELIGNLNVIRERVGAPIYITSGYRTPAHNAKQPGAAKNSYHTRGMAADIRVAGMSATHLRNIIKQMMDGGEIMDGGLKAYPRKGFVHYDIRGNYMTW